MYIGMYTGLTMEGADICSLTVLICHFSTYMVPRGSRYMGLDDILPLWKTSVDPSYYAEEANIFAPFIRITESSYFKNYVLNLEHVHFYL